MEKIFNVTVIRCSNSKSYDYRYSRERGGKMNKIFVFLILTLLVFLIPLSSQESEKLLNDFSILKGPYLGQKPPGMTPEIFAPEVVSGKNLTSRREYSKFGLT